MPAATSLETLLPEFRAYAMSLTSARDQAEDLVQDAVERALTAKTCPTALNELRPWMFRVIRNLHVDTIRKNRVRLEYSQDVIRYSDEAGPGQDIDRDILIRLAFEKLPPDHREVLFLVDIVGLKYAEAAEVIGVANGTIMSRVSRARKALYDLVECRELRAKRTKD